MKIFVGQLVERAIYPRRFVRTGRHSRLLPQGRHAPTVPATGPAEEPEFRTLDPRFAENP
jgi:hypothetical protein